MTTTAQALVAHRRWLPVPGFDGYDVSDCGHVRSWRHKTGRRKKPWTLSRTVFNNGYEYVHLYGGDVAMKIPVHRLVLLAFVGEPPAGAISRHLDGDRLNNSAANLRWGTPQENQDDRIEHGTTCRGSRNPNALLTEIEVMCIFHDRRPHEAIGEAFGVTAATVESIKGKRSWGWLWRHLDAEVTPCPS